MAATKALQGVSREPWGSAHSAAVHSVPGSRLQFGTSPRGSSRLMADAALPQMWFVH